MNNQFYLKYLTLNLLEVTSTYIVQLVYFNFHLDSETTSITYFLRKIKKLESLPANLGIEILPYNVRSIELYTLRQFCYVILL